MTKAVFFDMDGVILDSMPYHVRAWQEAMADFGHRVPERLLYLHEGAIEPATAAAIFTQNGCPMDNDRFEAILARQMEIFTRRYRPHIQPFPEVPELLAGLREAGWKMALVTSSHGNILDIILPDALRALMDHVVTGDRVVRRKPFPDPYLAAVEAVGVGPERCVVVENAPAGIRAAKAAALHCVALTTTLGEADLAGADCVMGSHRELGAYLASESLGAKAQPVDGAPRTIPGLTPPV